MSTLAACIVAKNESRTIKICLDHIKDMVEQIVVVDTGSTDNTIDLIKEWVKVNSYSKRMLLHSVGDKFHDSDGDFNFGKAKTYALQSSTTNFVMWLDVSDILTDQKKARMYFNQATQHDTNVFFTMPTSISKTFNYNRVRIVPREYGNVYGRIHEYIPNPPNMRKAHIPIQFNNQKNGNNLDRNLRLLVKDWEDLPTSRNTFYIANTYREMGDNDNAIKWFRKRIYNFAWVEDFAEEHYKSAECIAEMMLKEFKRKDSKYSQGDMWDIADEMINIEPLRVEGYYYMGEMYYVKGSYIKALEQYNKYKKCKQPNPLHIKLWLDKTIYSDKCISKRIKECEFAIANAEPLKPESITDFIDGVTGSKRKSTYTRGNGQYNSKTIH